MEANGIHRRLDIAVTDSLLRRMKQYTSTTPNENGCLLWIGSQRNGYGAIKHQTKVLSAHCAAFVCAGGKLVEGHVIAHKCDVKLCVNPDHLECVTIQKNNADAHSRRVRDCPRGEACANALLTEELVKQIKSMFVPREFSYVKIARELNLPTDAVKHVIMGRTWAHVQVGNSSQVYEVVK